MARMSWLQSRANKHEELKVVHMLAVMKRLQVGAAAGKIA